MIIHSSISKQILQRSIETQTRVEETLFACAILIAFEQTGFTKVQFNLRTKQGSLHIEYKDRALTYYYRGSFSFFATCAMSVSVLSHYANSYTSHVKAEDALVVFQEFLRVSDQRDSCLILSTTQVTRQDQLPETRLNERSISLPDCSVDLVKVK